MRIVPVSTIAGIAAVLWAAPAAAQNRAEPTVEGYLCTFAGKCGDSPEAEQPTRVAPPTKGFRIAVNRGRAPAPAAETRRTGRAPANYAPRGASGYAARPSRPSAAAPARSRAGLATAPRSSEARADLMIGFDLNSARITPDGMAKARVFAQSLLRPELRTKRFLIEGHTDSLGGVPFNMDLSRRRAESVADFLAQQGVDRSRVEVRGFGPTNPLPGHRKSDPDNRRVEAKLIS